jgi:uncharacterized protein YecT (DUF1311 family)
MKRILLLLLVLAVSAVGFGQTQKEMNASARAAYLKADKDLNIAYKNLLVILDPAAKAKLKKAQLTWIKFRDEDTAFLGSNFEHGSIRPFVEYQRLTDLTKHRTEELKNTMSDLGLE